MVKRMEFGSTGHSSGDGPPSRLLDYLAAEDQPKADVSLRRIIDVSMQRTDRWHGPGDGWTLADWSNAACGEAGEMANQVKKIRRHETHVGTSYNTADLPTCVASAMEEAADSILYTVLVMGKLRKAYPGLAPDPVEMLIGKFNGVSAAQNFPERLP